MPRQLPWLRKSQADTKADAEQQFFCHLAHMHTAKFLTFLTCHCDVGAHGGLIEKCTADLDVSHRSLSRHQV